MPENGSFATHIDLPPSTSVAVPEATFLFFALVQFPIYFAPQIIKPFVPWLTAPPASVARSA